MIDCKENGNGTALTIVVKRKKGIRKTKLLKTRFQSPRWLVEAAAAAVAAQFKGDGVWLEPVAGAAGWAGR